MLKDGEYRPNFRCALRSASSQMGSTAYENLSPSLPKAPPKEQVKALRDFIYGSDFEPPSTFKSTTPAA